MSEETQMKKAKRKVRQMVLPGTKGASIKEVDAAAEAYVEARDKRMALTEKETAAHDTLVEVMGKHKLTVYRDDEASPPLVVTLKAGKTKVKVEKAEPPEADS